MLNETRTTCPPWTIHAWPLLLWQVDRGMALQLRHVGTHVTQAGDGLQRTAGQTIWAGVSDDGEAGMAWDWVQLSRGIVAMADPMAVVTNLRLLGPEGDALSAIETARRLNEIVHGLPWQFEVERALEFSRREVVQH